MRALRLSADGWRDVGWFDELLSRVAERGRGELCFVGGNRRGLLEQVRERGRDAPGCIAVGPGPVEADGGLRDGLVDVAAALGGLLSPLVELAVMVGATAMKLRRSGAGGADVADVFGWFDELVAKALKQADTVVFIVDAQAGDENLWRRRFTQYTARAGRLERQRLVLVVGLEDAPADYRAVDDTFPVLVREAAQLAGARKASWRWVPPLAPELVCEVLPQVAWETARLLVTVTGGEDHWALDRWNRWVKGRVVRPGRDGMWSLTGDPIDYVLKGTEEALDRIFGTDTERVDRAQLALSCAGLLGEEFCGETVVKTMVMAGEDYDSATDDLDALLGTDETPGLLSNVGYDPNLPGRTPEHLWRYKFDDPAVALYYRGAITDETERERLTRSLLTNLLDLRLTDGRFDTVIGRLARQLGDHDTARMIEQRAATRQELAHLDTDAALLLTLADTWDPTDFYLAEQLTTLTNRQRIVGNADLAVTCGTVALTLVQAHPNPPTPTTGSTLHSLGAAYWGRGDHDRAIEHLERALEHREVLFDSQPTPRHRKDLADTLHNLGAAYQGRGDHDRAIGHYTRALEHGQVLLDNQPTPTHRKDLADILHNLGGAYWGRGDHDRAIEHLDRALEHRQVLFDNQPTPRHHKTLADTLHGLGAAHNGRGDHDRAIGHYTRALEHGQVLFDNQPTPTHRQDLVSTLHGLGAAHNGRGDHDRAIEHLDRALEHGQVLFDNQPTPRHRQDLASTLHGLGAAHGGRGDHDRAIEHLDRALEHRQVLLDQHPTPTHRRHLQATMDALGQVRRAPGTET